MITLTLDMSSGSNPEDALGAPLPVVWYDGRIEIAGWHTLSGPSGAWGEEDGSLALDDHQEWAVWQDISRIIARADPADVSALVASVNADGAEIDEAEVLEDCEIHRHGRGFGRASEPLGQLASYLARHVRIREAAE